MNSTYIFFVVLLLLHAMGINVFAFIIKLIGLDKANFYKNHKKKIVMFVNLLLAFSIANNIPIFFLENLGIGIMEKKEIPNDYNAYFLFFACIIFSEIIYTSFIKTIKYIAKAKQLEQKVKVRSNELQLDKINIEINKLKVKS